MTRRRPRCRGKANMGRAVLPARRVGRPDERLTANLRACSRRIDWREDAEPFLQRRCSIEAQVIAVTGADYLYSLRRMLRMAAKSRTRTMTPTLIQVGREEWRQPAPAVGSNVPDLHREFCPTLVGNRGWRRWNG
jgi:hypothetical protein